MFESLCTGNTPDACFLKFKVALTVANNVKLFFWTLLIGVVLDPSQELEADNKSCLLNDV